MFSKYLVIICLYERIYAMHIIVLITSVCVYIYWGMAAANAASYNVRALAQPLIFVAGTGITGGCELSDSGIIIKKWGKGCILKGQIVWSKECSRAAIPGYTCGRANPPILVREINCVCVKNMSPLDKYMYYY